MRVDETSDGICREPSNLDAFFAMKLREYGVPGLSVAVVKDDRIVWARGFGFADLATSTPATPVTSYLWFSMTKIATATTDSPGGRVFPGLQGRVAAGARYRPSSPEP